MYRVSRWYLYGTMAISVLLQNTVLHGLQLEGNLPDLLFICVLFSGFYAGMRGAVEAALVAGFLKSVFSTEPLLLSLMVYVLCGALIGTIEAQFFREHIVTQIVMTFIVITLGYTVYYLVFTTARIVSASYGSVWSTTIFPTAAASVLAAPILFKILERGLRRVL